MCNEAGDFSTNCSIDIHCKYPLKPGLEREGGREGVCVCVSVLCVCVCEVREKNERGRRIEWVGKERERQMKID